MSRRRRREVYTCIGERAPACVPIAKVVRKCSFYSPASYSRAIESVIIEKICRIEFRAREILRLGGIETCFLHLNVKRSVQSPSCTSPIHPPHNSFSLFVSVSRAVSHRASRLNSKGAEDPSAESPIENLPKLGGGMGWSRGGAEPHSAAAMQPSVRKGELMNKATGSRISLEHRASKWCEGAAPVAGGW